jgi:hypothetical protein
MGKTELYAECSREIVEAQLALADRDPEAARWHLLHAVSLTIQLTHPAVLDDRLIERALAGEGG